MATILATPTKKSIEQSLSETPAQYCARLKDSDPPGELEKWETKNALVNGLLSTTLQEAVRHAPGGQTFTQLVKEISRCHTNLAAPAAHPAAPPTAPSTALTAAPHPPTSSYGRRKSSPPRHKPSTVEGSRCAGGSRGCVGVTALLFHISFSMVHFCLSYGLSIWESY